MKVLNPNCLLPNISPLKQRWSYSFSRAERKILQPPMYMVTPSCTIWLAIVLSTKNSSGNYELSEEEKKSGKKHAICGDLLLMSSMKTGKGWWGSPTSRSGTIGSWGTRTMTDGWISRKLTQHSASPCMKIFFLTAYYV